MLAAAVAAVLARAGVLADGRWLTLHLAFLGGVSQLVLGAGQYFVAAFLATDPPSRPLVGAQLICWNAGTVLVAVGVPTAATSALTGVGVINARAVQRLRARALADPDGLPLASRLRTAARTAAALRAAIAVVTLAAVLTASTLI